MGFQEVLVRNDEDGTKAAPKEMPASTVLPVEPPRVRAAQMLHPARERGRRRVDDEVEVSAHQAIRPTAPLVTLGNRLEQREQPLPVSRLPEDTFILNG